MFDRVISLIGSDKFKKINELYRVLDELEEM